MCLTLVKEVCCGSQQWVLENHSLLAPGASCRASQPSVPQQLHWEASAPLCSSRWELGVCQCLIAGSVVELLTFSLGKLEKHCQGFCKVLSYWWLEVKYRERHCSWEQRENLINRSRRSHDFEDIFAQWRSLLLCEPFKIELLKKKPHRTLKFYLLG